MRWLDDVTPWWIGERVSCPRCGKSYELTRDDIDSGAIAFLSSDAVTAICMNGCTVEVGSPPMTPTGFLPGEEETKRTVPVSITIFKAAVPTRVLEGPSIELSDSEQDDLRALVKRLDNESVRESIGCHNPEFLKVWDEMGDAIGEAGPAATIIGPGEELSPYTEDAVAEEGTPETDSPFDRMMRVALSSKPYEESNAEDWGPVATFDAADTQWTSIKGYYYVPGPPFATDYPFRKQPISGYSTQEWATMLTDLGPQLRLLEKWAAEVRWSQDPEARFVYEGDNPIPLHLECPTLGICMELP